MSLELEKGRTGALVISVAALGLLFVAAGCTRPAETEVAQASEPCAEDEVRCNAECAKLDVSIEHCGKCGRRCFQRQECQEGVCRGLGVVSARDLVSQLDDKDFLLINVRYPPVGVIPGTDATVPHDRLDKLKDVIGPDPDTRIVLYCGTAQRVMTPLRTLQEAGYRSIAYLHGGVTAWRMAGLPVEDN